MIAFGERSGPWGFGRAPGQSEQEWLDALVATMAERLYTFLAPTIVPKLLVRYEDYVVDLDATAAQLGSWLGVDLDATALHRAPDDHRTSASTNASIGRWRRDLDPDLADRTWHPLSTHLTSLGYLRDGWPPS